MTFQRIKGMTQHQSSAVEVATPHQYLVGDLPAATASPKLSRTGNRAVQGIPHKGLSPAPTVGQSSPGKIMYSTPHQTETLFFRHAKNPILTAADWPYSINCVF